MNAVSHVTGLCRRQLFDISSSFFGTMQHTAVSYGQSVLQLECGLATNSMHWLAFIRTATAINVPPVSIHYFTCFLVCPTSLCIHDDRRHTSENFGPPARGRVKEHQESLVVEYFGFVCICHNIIQSRIKGNNRENERLFYATFRPITLCWIGRWRYTFSTSALFSLMGDLLTNIYCL